MEHHEHEEFYRRLQKQNKQTPLDFKPPTTDLVDWVLSAFQFLSPYRQQFIGMGGSAEGMIPLSEIQAYVNTNPIFMSAEEFTNAIRTLDHAYLKNSADLKKRPKPKVKQSKTGPPKPR